MKQIKKRVINKIIELTIKYCHSDEPDAYRYLDLRSKYTRQLDMHDSDLVLSLARIIRKEQCTKEQAYEALKVLGYELV